jgi:hypothetical protein
MESGRGYEQKESDGSLKYSKPNDILQKKTVIFALYKGLADWPSARPMLPKKKKRKKQKSEDEEAEVLGCTEVLVYNHNTCSPKHAPFEGQFQASKTVFLVRM